MKTAHLKLQKGFTLIELLVVIGILAILLSITLIAINPAKQFSQANDTKRHSDVLAILNAIDQYAADNKGVLPSGITTSALPISDSGANICSLLVTTYIAQLPVDPLTNGGTPVATCSGSYNTNYTVLKSAVDNRVTVSAPATENGPVITVTR